MRGFSWTEAMSVGVSSLDADHRSLVGIIGQLENVTPDDAARVVGIVMEALAEYSRRHFAREERLLAACGFSGLSVHRAEHDAFCRAVERVSERRERVDPSSVAAETLDYLRGWLVHHILIQDMAYKPLVTPIPGVNAILGPEALPLSGDERLP